MKKNYYLILLLFMLPACSPSFPAPTVTAIPPTQTNTVIPTATNTPEPTVTETLEPTATATLEPTKVPMPDGWMGIAETKEIGGRQVVVNDKGEGATQIDGEWYPVDIKGCYYKEFFDPANQTDPKIDALLYRINYEKAAFMLSGDDIDIRHYGVDHTASLKGGYPVYRENFTESIIFKQMLCLNSYINNWTHIILYVQPDDEKETPETTKIMRATVGWIRNNRYVTFTYKQYGNESSKATTEKDAFQQWQSLINTGETVWIGVPKTLIVNNLGHWPEKEYGEALRKLVVEAPRVEKLGMFQENLNDPDFIEWVLSENNQMRYWGDKKNWYTYCRNDRKWHILNKKRCMGEEASEGKFPEIVARVVIVQ